MNGDQAIAWGWHPDPYGIHEERYISVEGMPTKLVRDGGKESYDLPPEAGVREQVVTGGDPLRQS